MTDPCAPLVPVVRHGLSHRLFGWRHAPQHHLHVHGAAAPVHVSAPAVPDACLGVVPPEGGTRFLPAGPGQHGAGPGVGGPGVGGPGVGGPGVGGPGVGAPGAGGAGLGGSGAGLLPVGAGALGKAALAGTAVLGPILIAAALVGPGSVGGSAGGPGVGPGGSATPVTNPDFSPFAMPAGPDFGSVPATMDIPARPGVDMAGGVNVPEPASVVLFAAAAVVVLVRRRVRRGA